MAASSEGEEAVKVGNNVRSYRLCLRAGCSAISLNFVSILSYISLIHQPSWEVSKASCF